MIVTKSMYAIFKSTMIQNVLFKCLKNTNPHLNSFQIECFSHSIKLLWFLLQFYSIFPKFLFISVKGNEGKNLLNIDTSSSWGIEWMNVFWWVQWWTSVNITSWLFCIQGFFMVRNSHNTRMDGWSETSKKQVKRIGSKVETRRMLWIEEMKKKVREGTNCSDWSIKPWSLFLSYLVPIQFTALPFHFLTQVLIRSSRIGWKTCVIKEGERMFSCFLSNFTTQPFFKNWLNYGRKKGKEILVQNERMV